LAPAPIEDRSIADVQRGQIASVSLDLLSARDALEPDVLPAIRVVYTASDSGKQRVIYFNAAGQPVRARLDTLPPPPLQLHPVP
jgi:hypothetical protein